MLPKPDSGFKKTVTALERRVVIGTLLLVLVVYALLLLTQFR